MFVYDEVDIKNRRKKSHVREVESDENIIFDPFHANIPALLPIPSSSAPTSTASTSVNLNRANVLIAWEKNGRISLSSIEHNPVS